MKLSSNTVKRRKARIEIIPLIDIMFFLLATFVLVSFSMTENKGLIVSLPISKSTDKSTASKQDKDTVTITIMTNGSFALDKKEVNLEQIKLELTQLKRQTNNLKLIVLGDQGSKLQDTISILDLTKELGLESVTLRTKSQ